MEEIPASSERNQRGTGVGLESDRNRRETTEYFESQQAYNTQENT